MAKKRSPAPPAWNDAVAHGRAWLRKYRRWWPWLLIPLFFVVNWTWQALRKPSEVVGLLDSGFYKSPEITWKAFGDLFVSHSTELVPPELLAALAQAESRGNPIARTYWRWRWSWNPFYWYMPASSAVGLFQITDGTFAEASRYCLHYNKVVKRTAWYDPSSCWFNWTYNRLLPSHAAEMTAAYLHVQVEKMAYGKPIALSTKHDLAALSHLCGPGVAQMYLKQGFRFAKNTYCDAHDPQAYLKKIRGLMATFRQLK